MAELSTYRKEIKYVISKATALKIVSDLEKLLKEDSHNNMSEAGYIVRSLYFDSITNTDYYEKLAGTEIRKKIRLRVYGINDEKCKLELKQKFGDNQHKESLIVSREDAKYLFNGDYTVLRNYFSESELAVKIYSSLVLGSYRPAAIIEYDRKAFLYDLYDIRVTLDSNVRSSESNYNIFDENIIFTPILNEHAILEVKYSGKMIGFISDILSKHAVNQTSYSKYENGRKIIGMIMD